ncbi:MAG: ankyrin repeat domain-containing protein [Betaproteobacteria bacterium]
MRTMFQSVRRLVFPTATALFLSLLLAGCASTPSRLTQAALAGDTATLDDLLKSGAAEINTPATFEIAQPACPGQKTITPLQAAACAGQESAIRGLLARKADIDLATGTGQTPLMLAMTNGRDAAARLLVDSGARLETADATGNTPLLLAASKGDRAFAEYLLKKGASPMAQNKAGGTALLLSTDVGLSKTLAALGADPLALTIEGDSGLHLAAKLGNAQTALFFLEHGVDVSLRNRSGATALTLARVSAGGSAAATVRATVAARRRAASPEIAGRAATPVDPERARNRAEVAAVIEEWIGRSLREEITVADRAARAGRSGEALELYTATLAKAADTGGTVESDLRVKIVQYAASLPQPPGIPEKAREHLVRSAYLLKKGQDIGLVENEITAALRLAPWWAEGYFNLGQLQAEQGKFDAAERNLNLFIKAAPTDTRVQAAQDKIYENRMAREEDEKFRGMQGRWVDGQGRGYATTINGNKILIRADSGLAFTLTQKNGILDGSVEGGSYPGGHQCTIPAQMHPVTGKLTSDARSITLEYLWSQYKTSFHCVNMAGIPSNCCLLCDEVCDAVTVSGNDRINMQLSPAR